MKDAAFYAYASPQPAGFEETPARPPQARYDAPLGEFLLPYEAVCRSGAARNQVLEFFTSTYESCANLAGWDRHELERS